jgi:hypothetical protein
VNLLGDNIYTIKEKKTGTLIDANKEVGSISNCRESLVTGTNKNWIQEKIKRF